MPRTVLKSRKTQAHPSLVLGALRWLCAAYLSGLPLAAVAQVPTFTSSTNALGAVGVPFSYKATASGNPTSFAILNPPSWLSTNIVGSDGVFTGLPQQAGNLTLQMVASNSSGTRTNDLFLQVNPPAKPQITSPLVVFAAQGVQFGYNFTVDPDPLYVPTVIGVSTNNGASFLTNNLANLGNGLQLRTNNVANPAYPYITNTTYRIFGVTSNSGTFQLPIRAVNGVGGAQVSVEALTLVVGPAGDPIITSPSAAPGIVGVPFNFTVTAANAPLEYVFSTNNGASWSPAGTVLSGLTFSNVVEGPNRYARITGMPSFAKVPANVTFTTLTNPTGVITNFTPVIGNGGAGYSPTTPPAVWIAPPPAGGTQAGATAQVSPAGVITNVVITAPGSGYTNAPAVVIADLLLKAGNNNAPAGGAIAPLQIAIAEPQPTIVLTQPLGEANYVSGSSFFVNAQAFDAVPDIIIPGSVAFTASGVALTGEIGRLGDVYGQEFYPNVANPVLQATAQNTLGQINTSVALPMANQVPRRPLPSIEMLPLNPGPAPQAGGEVTLRARATIPSVSTSIDRVEFYVNKVYVGAAQSGTNNEYEFRYRTPAQAGSFEVQARAVSVNINAGELAPNSPPFYASVIARRPVVVNTLPGTAPVVAITSPANNGVLAVGVANSISASASLDGGAIDSVAFYANGRLIGEDTGVPFEVNFTPNSFGAYELFAIAKGSNGLQTVSPVVVVNAPSGFVPTVTIDSPTSNITLPFGSPILVAYTSQDTDGFVQSLQLLVNGAVVDELDANVNGLIGNGLIPYTPPSQGVYNFVVRVTDNQGNSGVSTPVQVTVQSGASNPLPTVVLSSQTFAENRYVVGSEFFFNATVTPKDGATIPDTGVDFFIGNTRILGQPSGLPSGQGIFTARDRLDNEGQLQVLATAKDSAGNTGISGRVPLLMNNPRNPLPVVEVLPLNPGTSPAAGGTVRLRARAIFPASTPNEQRVEFYVRGVLVGVGVPNATEPQVYEFEWLSPATPGSFRVDARAVAANYGTVFAGENFVVYGSAISATHREVTTGVSAVPTVSIKSPVNNTSVPVGGSITLQATASIAGSTIARVDYYGNGELLGSSATAADSYSVTYVPNSKGEVKLIAVATSVQGFAKESDPVTIKVPLNGDPEISFLSPASGTVFTPGTTFTAAAEVKLNTTLNAPIRDVRFFVNEVQIGEPDIAAPYSQQITLDSVGDYFLKAVATDIYGNTATVQQVVSSRAPPTGAAPIITVTHPTPGGGGDTQNDFSTPSQFFFNALVSLPTGVGVAPGGVKFFANGVPVAGTVNNVGDVYSIYWQPERNADYLITAQVTDSRGISAVSEPLQFIIAPPVRPLPTVRLLPLSSATAATGSTVYLQAETNGDITPVARVDFYANGVLIGSREVNTAAPTVTIFEWIPEVAANYTLTARAIQVLGEVGDNSIISASRPLNVVAAVGQSPLVTLAQQTISEARYVAGSQFFFNATAVPRGGATLPDDGVSFYYGGQILAAEASGVMSGAQEIFAARGALTVAPSTEFVFATAIDSNSNIGSSSVSSIIGQRPLNPLPSVQMEPFLPGALQQAGGTVKLRASAIFPPNANAEARVEFYANGAFVGTGAPDATNPSLYTFDWKTPSTPGNFEIHARAVALNFQTNTGNNNAERNFGSVISPLPLALNTIAGVLPTVEVTSPANSAQIGVSVPTTVRASASVTGGILREVRFYANGIQIGEPDTQAPYEVPFTPTSPGLYKLYAIAESQAGIIQVSGEVQVNATSGTAPSVSITTPSGNLNLPQVPLTIAWLASDTDGSVQSVQILVNGLPTQTFAGGAGSLQYTFPSQGTYVFVARATDNLGNVKDSDTRTVTVNNGTLNPLPQVTLLNQTIIDQRYVAGSQLYFNATAQPRGANTIASNGVTFSLINASGVSSLQASNTPIRVAGNTVYASAYEVTSVDFPSSTLFASAKDSSNNVGTSATSGLLAAAPLTPFPTVEALPLAPSARPVAGGVVQLRAKASFPSAGTNNDTSSRVEFYADGAFLGVASPNANAATTNLFTHVFDWVAPTNSSAVSYRVTARAVSKNATIQVLTTNFQVTTTNSSSTVIAFQDLDFFASVISPQIVPVNVSTNAPPSVVITKPSTNNAVFPVGVAGLVEAAVTTATNASVREVQFYVDGLYVTNDTTSPYLYPFAPANAGVYNIAAVAIDSFGLQGSSAVRTVNATSGSAPTVSLTTPSASTTNVTVNSPLTLTADAADTDGSVVSVTFLANGVPLPSGASGEGAQPVADSTNPDTTSPYRYSFTPTNPGRYEIVARAVDNLGNVTDSAPKVINAVTGASPSVAITNPANSTPPAEVTPGIPVAVTVNASDSDGSVVRVDLLVNGAVVGFSTQAPYIFTDAGQFSGGTNTTFTPTSEGLYTIVARATDNLGNVTDSVPVTVRAKSPTPIGVAPSVQITQPIGEIYYVTGSSLFLNARATDAPPGEVDPDSVQFTVNGLPIPGAVIGQIGNDYGVRYTPTVPFSIDTIRAQATDNDNNTTYSQPNYTVLTLAQAPLPQVQVLPLLPGTPLDGGGIIKLRAEAIFPPTANQQARVEFYANNVLVGTGTADATNPQIYTLDWKSPQTPAAYIIEARAVALNFQTNVGEGNVIEYFGSVISDNNIAVNTIAGTPPDVEITAPANGATVTTGQPVTITATAQVPAPPAPGLVQVRSPEVALVKEVRVSAAQSVTKDTTVLLNLEPVPGFIIPVLAPVSGIVQRILVLQGQTVASAQLLVEILQAETDVTTPLAGTVTSIPVKIGDVVAVGAQVVGIQLPGGSTGFVTSPVAGVVSAIYVSTGNAVTAGQKVVKISPQGLGSPTSTIAKVEFYANGVFLGEDANAPYSLQFTPQSLGIYNLNAIAYSGAGLVATSTTVSISSVLGQPPTVVMTRPTQASATAAVSGGSVTALTVGKSGSGYTTPPVVTVAPPPGAGTQATFTATLGTGANAGRVIGFVPVNTGSGYTTAPTVTIAPPSGTVGSSLLIQASVSDPDGTIAQVEFLVNGLVAQTTTTAPYSYNLPLSSTGLYRLQVRATDNSGNIGVSAVEEFTVTQGAPPVVSITSPANGSTIPAGQPVTVTANASDTDGSVINVTFFQNGTQIGEPDTQAPYSASFTPASPGQYTLVAVALDNSGNLTQSSPSVVTVPSTVVTATVVSPVNNASFTLGTPVILTAAASTTAGATITSVRFEINSQSIGSPITTAPYTTSYVPPALGSYTVRAVATDSSGGTGVSAPITFTVKNPVGAPPSIWLSQPSQGNYLTAGSTLFLNYTTFDPEGEIDPATLRIFVNGVPQTNPAPRRIGPGGTTFGVQWNPGVTGNYVVTAQVSDFDGNTASSGVTTLTVLPAQKTVPQITIDPYFSASQYLAVGEPITLRARAKFFATTEPLVEFYANGVFVGTAVAGASNTDGSVSYSFNWIPDVAGSPVTLTARAVGINFQQPEFTTDPNGDTITVLSNVYASTLSNNRPTPPVTDLTINEVAPAPAPGSNEAFVKFIFPTIFNRPANFSEYKYYVDQLNAAGSPAPAAARASAIQELMATPEYNASYNVVYSFYYRLGLQPTLAAANTQILTVQNDTAPETAFSTHSPGQPAAPNLPTIGMSRAAQNLLETLPNQTTVGLNPNVTKAMSQFSNLEFLNWLIPKLGGQAFNSSTIGSSMNAYNPQSRRQGAALAFLTQLYATYATTNANIADSRPSSVGPVNPNFRSENLAYDAKLKGITINFLLTGQWNTSTAPLSNAMLATLLTNSSAAARPVITSGNAAGVVGEYFTYQIEASNNPGGYTAGNLPLWLRLNPQTGLLTGRPGVGDDKIYTNVKIGAQNWAGEGSKFITINILPAAADSALAALRGRYGNPTDMALAYGNDRSEQLAVRSSFDGLELTWTQLKNADAYGVTYEIESSTNLGFWTSVTLAPGQTPQPVQDGVAVRDANDYERVRVTLPISGNRSFYRVRASFPD